MGGKSPTAPQIHYAYNETYCSHHPTFLWFPLTVHTATYSIHTHTAFTPRNQLSNTRIQFTWNAYHIYLISYLPLLSSLSPFHCYCLISCSYYLSPRYFDTSRLVFLWPNCPPPPSTIYRHISLNTDLIISLLPNPSKCGPPMSCTAICPHVF